MLHLQANTKEYDQYKKAYDTGALFEIEGFTLISKNVHCTLEIEKWQAVHDVQSYKDVITLTDVDIRLDVRENLLVEIEKLRKLFKIFTEDDKTPAMIESLSEQYIRARKHLRMVEGIIMERENHYNYIPF